MGLLTSNYPGYWFLAWRKVAKMMASNISTAEHVYLTWGSKLARLNAHNYTTTHNYMHTHTHTQTTTSSSIHSDAHANMLQHKLAHTFRCWGIYINTVKHSLSRTCRHYHVDSLTSAIHTQAPHFKPISNTTLLSFTVASIGLPYLEREGHLTASQ